MAVFVLAMRYHEVANCWGIHTNLRHDFCKVVGMSAQLEEADITNSTRLLARPLLEAVFLSVRDSLEAKSQDKNDNGDDICRLAEGRLAVCEDVRTVQNGDRE